MLQLVCAPSVSNDLRGGMQRLLLRIPSEGQKLYSDSNACDFDDIIDLNDLVVLLYTEFEFCLSFNR